MKVMLAVFAFVLLARGIGVAQTSEAEAFRVLDEFMTAFNNRDFDVIAELFHYPHVRIARGVFSIWNKPEEFKAARSPADQERSSYAYHESSAFGQFWKGDNYGYSVGCNMD